MLTENQINEGFNGHLHCSQQVVREWADKLGYDRDEAMRMAAPFGAGLWNGDSCGAVCGAMMVIGKKYGHCELGDAEGNDAMIAKTREFNKEFIARNGSLACRDLVKYDFSKEGELEKAFMSGRISEFCPKMVIEALEILDDIM